jgi:hypothetical protein
MDMDKRVKIYHIPEDSHNTITMNIKQLFDILCNISFNNTSLKIATLNYIEYQTVVGVLCNKSCNNTSLKMATIQLH